MRFHRNEEARRMMGDWQMQLSRDLLEVPARHLPVEKMIGGQGTVSNF
jgi:hypothetical protein